MIVEFRVGNFRSIRDEQLLSLVASGDKDEKNIIYTSVKAVSRLVTSAAIYGLNAGGKSNLIDAMLFMQNFIASSNTISGGQKILFQPFLLDKSTLKEPSFFEITFLSGTVRYQYGFILNAERIVKEWLLEYYSAKPRTLFVRHYNEEKNSDEYDFSDHLKGPKKSWETVVTKTSLFLSVIGQTSAENVRNEKIRNVFDFLASNILIFRAGQQPNFNHTIERLKKGEEAEKEAVLEFLQKADISVAAIELKEHKDVVMHKIEFNDAGVKSAGSEKVEGTSVIFKHQTDNGSADFDLFANESLGTQKLFAFAAILYDVLKHGKILIMDEIEAHLHPLLVEWIITKFNDTKSNPHHAQLLFTTHNTYLLDLKKLRRDQIWFIEKDKDQASILSSLLDFSPRKSIAKGYLGGRYGAIPMLE